MTDDASLVASVCQHTDDVVNPISLGSVAFERFSDVATQIGVGTRQRWRVEAADRQ